SPGRVARAAQRYAAEWICRLPRDPVAQQSLPDRRRRRFLSGPQCGGCLACRNARVAQGEAPAMISGYPRPGLFVTQRFNRIEARGTPRWIERGENRESKRHHYDRYRLARVHFGRQLRQVIELRGEQVSVGDPADELAQALDVEADKHAEQKTRERADDADARDGNEEDAHHRASRRDYGAQNGDVVALVLHQNDEARHDIERSDQDYQGED